MRQIRKVDCIGLMQMQWANYPLWPALPSLQKPTRRARAALDRKLPTMLEPCEDHRDWARANLTSEPPTLRFDQIDIEEACPRGTRGFRESVHLFD